MRNITRASIALIGAVALTGVTAMSASAAVIDTDDGAAVTVAVAGGSLVLGTPAALGLTSSAPGVDASGTLGTMTVTDNTASTTPWTVSITTTDFVSQTAGAPTIPADQFTYTANQAVVTGAGVATVAPSTVVTGDNTVGAVVQTATGVSGNHVATWDATVTLDIPANALAGSYAGTITHSVS